MIQRILIFIIVLPLLSATQLPRGFQEDLVVYGLRRPVAAEFAPDGRLFILEKDGRIRILKNGKLLPKPFLKLNVNTLYERGLLGLALDPNFASNQYVYIYRTTSEDSPQNVVERYTANGDVGIVSSRLTLVSGIHSDTGVHNGGCLKFGPDGKLYISTGDADLNPDNAQNLGNLNGKILRINSDGTVPSDNPFVGQPDRRPEIYCYGFRNPWRFTFLPGTGLLIVGDVGGNNYEEINVCRPGNNFGWPNVEGPGGNPSYVDPVHSYNHDLGGAAVIIGEFYSGTKFPSKYRNRLFFTDYSRRFIRMMKFDNNGNPQSSLEIATNLTNPVHMLQGPDGSILYLNLNSGDIRKVRFVGGRNRPPVVEAGASRRSGPTPLTVRFNANGTIDPDGHPLTYEWDFGDGQKESKPNVIHTYSKKGIYDALLTVRDTKGGVGFSRPIKITVGNEAPVATILTPADGTVVHLGEIVQFKGKGSDPEDGPIPAENMVWSARLYHDEHTHPALGGVRGPSGFFPIPSTLHADGHLFFRLRLTVTDSEGLSSSTTVDLPLEIEK
jgi:glucose/arabinose dehydrogenase